MGIIFLPADRFRPGEIVEFNIEIGRDGRNPQLSEISSQLEPCMELSYGKVYRQRDNDSLWYISPGAVMARRITQEQSDFFREWDREILLPDNNQFESLKAIGGLPSLQLSMEPDSIQFPASVITTEGERLDYCIIHFSKAPPFQRWFHKILPLNEVDRIEPSEYALPHNLRLSSILAGEIRMGFSPFMVKTNSGHFITYNGVTQFASAGGLQGKDIAEEVLFSWKKYGNEQADIPFGEITFVIGKWDNRFDNLLIEYRRELSRKASSRNNPLNTIQRWLKSLF